jgi:cysteine desulfuration protein SufE
MHILALFGKILPMSETISDKIAELKSKFGQYDNWEDRYKIIMDLGKSVESIEKDLLADKFKIKGCQSQVWLIPEFKDGVILFKADSDSVLVKGIVNLLTQVYSGESPQAILDNPPQFLEDIGITQHLSLNRTNGLRSMVKQIQMYAFAFKSMQG